TSMREIGMLAKLLGALAGKVQHVILAAEVQTARRAGLDARGLQPFANAIRAKSALENAMRLRVHFRNVKGAPGDAVAAADAIGLLEINDAVGVLHDGTVRGTRRQASGLRAMHALVLAHQPHQRDRKSTRLNSSHQIISYAVFCLKKKKKKHTQIKI